MASAVTTAPAPMPMDAACAVVEAAGAFQRQRCGEKRHSDVRYDHYGLTGEEGVIRGSGGHIDGVNQTRRECRQRTLTAVLGTIV